MSRLHPANLRAAWWALRTARRTRRLLTAGGLDAALGPAAPPPLPAEAGRGVRAALGRLQETCLVNSIVRQAWEAAHGQRRDLVVGVTGPNGFRAHAWLQGDPLPAADEAELDASELGMSGAAGWGTGEDSSANGEAKGSAEAAGSFHELLRRPAPYYAGHRQSRREVTPVR